MSDLHWQPGAPLKVTVSQEGTARKVVVAGTKQLNVTLSRRPREVYSTDLELCLFKTEQEKLDPVEQVLNARRHAIGKDPVAVVPWAEGVPIDIDMVDFTFSGVDVESRGGGAMSR